MEQKDFEAFGILYNLYKLGPSISFLPTLISFYDILMKTERGEEADKLADEILGILKNRLKVSYKECKRLAKSYRNEKWYFKSVLFDLIGNHLLSELKDSEGMLSGIGNNMARLQESINDAVEESSCYKKTLRLWVLPRMHVTLQAVFRNAFGKSKKALAIVEVLCKHKLEISEYYVDDLDARERTLLEQKSQLLTVLGDEAKKLHIFGTVLNNLGANCLQQKKPLVAKDYLTEAIEVNMNAEDYTSEEERKGDVERSERALGQVDDMLQTTA